MKKIVFYAFMFFLFSLLSLGMPAHPTAAAITTISLSERSEVEKDKILLGKIATIKSEDHGFAGELRNMVIGKAPLPGKSRWINSDYIKIRLKQKGIDLSQVRLEGPEEIEVSMSFIEISKEKIEKVVLNFVKQNLHWEDARVRVKKINVSNNLILPRGKVTYKVVPLKNRRLLGTIPIPIHFAVDGTYKKKVWTTVNIEVLKKVVVTKGRMKRFHEITEEDICLKEMNLAKIPSNVITNSEEVLGRRAKRTIGADVVLRTDLVEFPPLVKRGDVVLIVAESEGLRITAFGEVKKKGRRGERVMVENLASKKKVNAYVLDSNSVKVNF